MAAPAARVEAARQRLARHYLNELQAASAAFGSGRDHSAYGLARFDREWPQIKHWQNWSAAHSAHDPAAAHLCAQFPPAGAELLALRQTPQERIDWLRAGLAAARQIGDQRREAECLFLLAWALHKQASIDEAAAAAREALTLAQRLRERVITGRSLHLLGEIAVRRGQFEQALRLHTRGLRRLRAAGDQGHLAEVYFSLSELAYLQGDFAAARGYAEQSQALHEALGLSPAMNNNLTWLGVTVAESGDLAAGERLVRQSIAQCRAARAQGTLAHALYSLSNLMLVQGDRAQSQALIVESLQIAQASDEEWLIPYILLQRAELWAERGETLAAEHDIEQALGRVRASGYRLALSTALVQQAQVLLALERLAQARAALRESLEVASATRMAPDLAHGVLVAAQLWQHNGAGLQAAEWLGLLLSRPGIEQMVLRSVQALSRELEVALGAEAFAAAVARGRGLTLEGVVAQILAGLD